MPLWMKGALLMLIGSLTNMVLSFVSPIVGDSEAARGQRFGQGLVTLLCVIAGVVLLIIHFVRGNRDSTNLNPAKRAKSKTDALAVRSAGKNGRRSPDNDKAIRWAVLGLSLVLTTAVLVGFVVTRNPANVPPSGSQATDNLNSTKPLKRCPVTISVPTDSQVVPADVKLPSGTRLMASWAEK